MFRFRLSYFLLTLLLIGVEIFIGTCMHDAVIRPYGGDLLVVVVLYCLVRSFWDLPVVPLSLGILVFSYLVETGQYFHLADWLGFTRPSLMRTLIGTYFTWVDLLSYTLGIGLVLGAEGLNYYLCDHLSKRTRSSGPSGAGETPSC
ncbi:MAG TPA: DUF2809 domain-containing protein [Puia sp.]|nr:DUF2809 domain-containing protein [Puia sp.]